VDDARAKAAIEVDRRAGEAEGEAREDMLELARRIRAMFLRDMRKRAADLADDDKAAPSCYSTAASR
jgi:hypothetical protein